MMSQLVGEQGQDFLRCLSAFITIKLWHYSAKYTQEKTEIILCEDFPALLCQALVINRMWIYSDGN